MHDLEHANCLYTLEQVQDAAKKLALEINAHYQGKECIILYLLNGAVVFVGQILPYLSMRSTIDYIHATRYGKLDIPGKVDIIAEPNSDFENKHVLILDDIFDHGVTLNAVEKYCEQKGAASVESAVLIYKNLDDQSVRKNISSPKFFALESPNYFLFGCGMDAKGYGRNAPGIFYL